MKRFFLVLAVLSLAVFIYGQPARADLVVNGSFENPNGFVANADGAMSLPAGSATMTGWTVINAELAWIGPTASWEFSASNGSYFLDLTGYHDSLPFTGVQQTIITNPGQSYLVKFDLGSSAPYGLPSAITAAADSTSQTFISTNSSSSNAWEHFSLPFIASSGTTTISFEASQGHWYVGLDNVTVSTVPIPPAVWLLGSGLLSLTAVRRRVKT
jgi:hypothetical protein